MYPISYLSLPRLAAALALAACAMAAPLSENSVAGWEMVKRGLGVGAMMSEIAERTPDLVEVLPEVVLPRFPVWLVTHRELHTSRRIRLVFDILAEALREGPAAGGVSTP